MTWKCPDCGEQPISAVVAGPSTASTSCGCDVPPVEAEKFDDCPECDCCRDAVPELRPICVEGREEPMATCSLCYNHLNAAGRIDWERDREEFEYGARSQERAITDGGRKYGGEA